MELSGSADWTVFDNFSAVDYFVDNSVFFGGLCVHDEVAVGVCVNSLEVLSGVTCEDAFQQVSHPVDFSSGQFDVGGLAHCLAVRLVE